jgi:hypothetical protein
MRILHSTGSPRAFSRDVVLLTENLNIGEKTMALFGALGGLVLCGCILAAVRSKKNSATEKVKTLTLK